MIEKHRIITDFLQVIGAEREAKRYLKLFQRSEPSHFAIIKIGGKVLESSEDIIAMDLAYLSDLNLYPVVIHGGGPQIDKALSEHGLSFDKIDGQRITTLAHMNVIKNVLEKINCSFVNKVQEYGGCAQGLRENIFIAESHPDTRLGRVGVVKKVNLAPILHVIGQKRVPIVSCLGYSKTGKLYNVNADTAAKSAVISMRPKKYLLITEQGGIRDKENQILANVNLTEEYQKLAETKVIQQGMLHKVREIKHLLEQVRYNLPVQITSSRGLLRELFTDQGSGTYIKLGGNILEFKDYNSVNLMRLKMLIEKAFKKFLKPDYFKQPISHLFLDKQYLGVAIVRGINNFWYLDKFCVREDAQGEGIALDLWHHVTKKCTSLFWRAKPKNPVRKWYYEKADGILKFNEWYLFWRNLDGEQIKMAKDYCLNLEESFGPNEE
jgi:acetylglutamate kinase